MNEKTLTLRDLTPILDVLGVETKDQQIYEFVLIANIDAAARVTIKRFIRADTGELKKICEQYELVKKESK